ncbi:phage holin [Ectobacillus sp. sgz5001026]|uniref:phage holin n=1 Tax=Ectobacillus sp. sgz5001026 TaxID=3242473 RepID=UPI0036D3FD32
MIQNSSDIARYITGLLLSLKLLLQSFGISIFTNAQVDAIANVVSFLYILYFGYKNNYIGKKGIEQKKLLKKHNLH